MAGPKKPYSIYKRKRKKSKPLMYVKFRGPDGNYLPGRSSGETSRSGAVSWALAELANGEVPVTKIVRFDEYADGFFDWDGKYLTYVRNRGRKFGMLHSAKMNGYLKNHLIPYFGHRRLTDIGLRDIETWQDVMLTGNRNKRAGAPLSPTSVNHMLVCLRTIFRQAVKDGLVNHNSCSDVEKLASGQKSRGAISETEAQRVFRDPGEWKDLRHYWICRLSYETGMRFGEVIALRWQDVEDGLINVKHSWGVKEGLKEPKTRRSKRRLRVAQWITDGLREYRDTLPKKTRAGFVFPSPDSDIPYRSQNIVNNALYAMLKRAKVERDERNVVFHSLRHSFHTRMRNKGVPDFLIQAYMGHSTPVMTDNYTDMAMANFDDVVREQNRTPETLSKQSDSE